MDSRLGPLLLAWMSLASCAGGPKQTSTSPMLRRADSSIVNRSIDELLKQWSPFWSLWEVGTTGKFVVSIDGVERIAHGFVLAYQYDSLPAGRCVSSRWVHRLIAWIPSPDSSGIEALWANSPGMPRRAEREILPMGECVRTRAMPDTQATLGNYRMVERRVVIPGYLAVAGKLWMDAGVITFRDRPCSGEGIRQTTRNYEIGCAERWYNIRIEASLVRTDSLRGRDATRHNLQIQTNMLPGRMLYVNCARRSSKHLCPGN